METGGPCLEGFSNPGDAQYIMESKRIIMSTPVDAYDNDVPYFYMNEANGCRFSRLGLRSVPTGEDVGPSGAFIVDSPTSAFEDEHPALARSNFEAIWMENLHAPNGGSLYSVTAVNHVFSDPHFYDCDKDVGATETAYFRFHAVPNSSRQGGNEVRGIIPGRKAGSNRIDWGVDLAQSCNGVVGPKGYNGYNVRVNLGATASSSTSAGNRAGTPPLRQWRTTTPARVSSAPPTATPHSRPHEAGVRSTPTQ